MMAPLSICQRLRPLPGGLSIVDCFAAFRAAVEGSLALGASGKSEPISLIAMTQPINSDALQPSRQDHRDVETC